MAVLRLVTRVATGADLSGGDRARTRTDVELGGFRDALRSVLLQAWLGADASVVTPALGGLFKVVVRPDDHGPGAQIARHGVWEPQVAAWWPRLVNPGATIVDVGANVGFHALHAAVLAGPRGRVVAVEPDPENVSLLRMACSLLSGAAPVEVVEAALSDKDGTLVFSDLGNPGNSGARFTHPEEEVLRRLVVGPAPTFSVVRALRWDDHFGEVPIDLVKLDVEGAEPLVLRGMTASLERFRPAVLSEFAPGNLEQLGGVRAEDYLTWFFTRRYRAWAVSEPDGALKAIPNARWRPGEHHADLLLLPEERVPQWIHVP
jgi:FkbM family methyltransferase